MAEVIIKSNLKEGDVIAVGFNKKKEEITMKVVNKVVAAKELDK